MSAEFQPSVLQSFRLFKDNGANVLQPESPPSTSKLSGATAGITEANDACPQLKFSSLTLDELSAELDRRTKETQRLQEEVENATKLTLERFACTHGSQGYPGKSSHNHNFDDYDSSKDSPTPSPHPPKTSPLACGMYWIPDQCEHKTSSLDKATVNLKTELHKVQMEKDIMSDLRLKDSRTHVVQMEKMLCMLEELQNIKRAGDQKLQQTDEETLSLNKEVETLERNVKEMPHATLSHNKDGQDITTSSDMVVISSQLNQVTELMEESNNGKNKLQEKPFMSQEHPMSEERRGANEPNERIEDLIACLGQEVVLLTEKLSSSKNDSSSLSTKLETLKELAERQTSLHLCQVLELESTLHSHKDKVCCLEQQLIQAQSQLVDIQREREKSLQHVEELHSQICQLKRCGEQQQCELQDEVKVLRGQLEEAREQLRQGKEEKTCLEALLEQRAREGREVQELLEKKTTDLHSRQQEAEQYLAWLEVAQTQCQILQAEGQTVRLQLDDRERMLEVLRSKMESSIQMSEQHSHAINNLHQENSLLSNQLNQHKQEIEQLRVELEMNKSDLAAAEQERRRLRVSVEEQSQHLQEETLKKQQLSSQLAVLQMQFLNLTEEHQQLQQLHIYTSEEHKGVVLKLQGQLRNSHKELDQVRSTLRTLEGADEHGLQVAMEMQKKVTARREQIDSLQSKIQHLEETIEKLHQGKRQQSLEHQHQLQELSFIREEKRQLRREVEALRSKDKQLRERIDKVEAILHKMSESFADCQDFIQLKEQEFFRLKLQHALDLKELQGQNLTAPYAPPPDLDSPSPSALTAPPSSQHAFNTHITQKESPAKEFRSLVKELQGVLSENHRPHTEHASGRSSFLRRRSAPAREHSTSSSDKDKEVKAASRFRRKTCGSEPHIRRMAELNGKMIHNKPHTDTAAGRFSSSLQFLSLGRRSPVHTLLTSDPNSHQ
ncbi:coiled-coil domain-containing protein 158-like isoform X5 [Xyrichtys novacula]|uniref:Coiled-coil domain-containing protein 158-like isoform X5 n=1 Tax=Xyrichtys novacula TaxID=13765 RepID=A0AAV1G747_XYRNO|nr:coiled-coil domain-containing protein 158-like isoform X5 [Xyrichtys novacula]